MASIQYYLHFQIKRNPNSFVASPNILNPSPERSSLSKGEGHVYNIRSQGYYTQPMPRGLLHKSLNHRSAALWSGRPLS